MGSALVRFGMFLRDVTVRKLLVLILTLGVVPIATAQIALRVCEADGVTPFDGSDIMVGTNLTLIVSSDANDYWSGGLFVAGQDRALATLSARDSDPNTRDCADSHYVDAGDMARVTAWKDSEIWGFDLYGSDVNTVAGDWFIIDYKAIGVGDPDLGFYDYSISWNDPNYLVTFHHVPTRDFNSDEVVDVLDCVIIASYWLEEGCTDPNWCFGTDINRDGYVDMADFGLFKKFWLWGVPTGEEPNTVPNVMYSVVDANGLNEITLSVNDSITLYVDMVSLEPNSVNFFHVDVNISDPNLGSIDNTEYDFYNPPGPGTAEILAWPRDEGFDYWGPGLQQEEGIRLRSVGSGPPISDGHMASFVYTCNGEGDVTLEPINWNPGDIAELQSIVIHQLNPESQLMMGLPATSQLPETVQNVDIDELVISLEQMWLDYEEIRQLYSEDEWDAFVDSVKNAY